MPARPRWPTANADLRRARPRHLAAPVKGPRLALRSRSSLTYYGEAVRIADGRVKRRRRGCRGSQTARRLVAWHTTSPGYGACTPPSATGGSDSTHRPAWSRRRRFPRPSRRPSAVRWRTSPARTRPLSAVSRCSMRLARRSQTSSTLTRPGSSSGPIAPSCSPHWPTHHGGARVWVTKWWSADSTMRSISRRGCVPQTATAPK